MRHRGIIPVWSHGNAKWGELTRNVFPDLTRTIAGHVAARKS
jgi:hypothetical protein